MDIEPAWSSNYTLNINLQMNLWSADAFQFTEALTVLHEFVEQLSIAGQRTAAELYGANGWVIHHNSDLWRNSAPTTLVEVGLFAGAGPWLVQQLVRHHESYPEHANAKELLALLSGLIAFFETWLVEDVDGFLAPSPSTSPENAYLLGSTPRPRSRADDPEYWRHGWLGEASTIDIVLVKDTLTSAIALGRELDVPDEQVTGWSQMLARLRPLTLQGGEIPEWTWPYRALELGHRHLSPLYGLYPGGDDYEKETAWHEAARSTLLNRQANVTSSSNGWGGWSKVWAAACWARLGDGDRALASVESLVQTGIAPDSLLHAFPVFDGEPGRDAVHQSDANLGLPAAISEMLVRSSRSTIRLLPALPSRWHSGAVRALRAAGGVDVTFEWVHGRVDRVRLVATRDQAVTLTAPGVQPGSSILRRLTLTAGTPIVVSLVEGPHSQEEARS
jgi:alpha-L-fucosidase 2